MVVGSPRGLVVFEWCAPRAEWFVERRARSRFVTVNAVLLTVRFVAQSSRVLCTFGIVFVSLRRFAGMARFAAWQAASAISSRAHFCIRGLGGLSGRRLSHQRLSIHIAWASRPSNGDIPLSQESRNGSWPGTQPGAMARSIHRIVGYHH